MAEAEAKIAKRKTKLSPLPGASPDVFRTARPSKTSNPQRTFGFTEFFRSSAVTAKAKAGRKSRAKGRVAAVDRSANVP
jgi:hypothetical protein